MRAELNNIKILHLEVSKAITDKITLSNCVRTTFYQAEYFEPCLSTFTKFMCRQNIEKNLTRVAQ